jgi:hypothetical protein
MERKIFLKNRVSALGLAFVAPLLKSCAKETVTDTTSVGGTNTGTGTGTCEASPSETRSTYFIFVGDKILQKKLQRQTVTLIG